MKKYFPLLILISALFISITGSFFSIYGLGKLFGGHQVGATILALAFEFGNIIAATSLKYYWKHLPQILKIPLVLVVITLTILTSMGIYGYLSDGYQKTALKDEIVTKRSNLVKIKKETFEKRIEENKSEISTLNNSIQELTKSYNQNTQTQQVIKGQVVTNVIVGNKKGLEQQLNNFNQRKVRLDSINSIYLDSVQRLELQIIEIENSNEATSELGPLKYLSQLTNQPMNKIVNYLILLIVIVFQPLALMLILTSMFAYKNNHYNLRKSKKNNDQSLFKPIQEKITSWFTPKINPLINVPKPEIIIPKKPMKKRIKSEPENEEKIVEVIEPETVNENINTDEVKPKVEKTKREGKRKVIDTNLTAELAEHIAKSLPNKKKV